MKEVLRIVLSNATRNARRTTLLALPILAGNLVVVGLFAGAVFGADQITERLQARGGDLIFLWHTQDSNNTSLDPMIDAAAVRTANLSAISSAGGVIIVPEPELSLSAADVRTSSVELKSVAMLVDVHALAAFAAPLQAGRLLRPDDSSGPANVAVLGSDLASHYGITDRTLAESPTVRFFGERVRIVGVLEPSTRYSLLNSAIVLPHTAPVIFSTGATSDEATLQEYVAVRSEHIALVESAVPQLVKAVESDSLPSAVRPEFDGSLLLSYRDALSSLRFTLLIAGVLGIVGSLVSCTYLQRSSFKLRSGEFGTRLALGGTTKSLRSMLWLESMAIGLIAWAASVLVLVALVRTAPVSSILLVVASTLALTLVVSAAIPVLTSNRLLMSSPAELLAND